MSELRAFHNDPIVKAKYLDRVRLHAFHDQIIHGKYWQNGKGCAVGCTIHSANHRAYESELGIPVMLARLEDQLFEGQSNGNAKLFPERFLLAAQVGADLSRVGWKFLHWLLTEELVGRDDPRVSAQIKRCADVLVPLTKGEPVDQREATAAAEVAAYAANAYADAAEVAAYAYASDTAAYTAYAAADTAYPAYASGAPAYASGAAAYAAYAAYASDAAAKTKCYNRMAEKLLQLMSQCEGEPIRVAMGVAA